MVELLLPSYERSASDIEQKVLEVLLREILLKINKFKSGSLHNGKCSYTLVKPTYGIQLYLDQGNFPAMTSGRVNG